MDFEDFRPQFKEVADQLEARFADVCDFDFTVQQGKLYVHGASIARRSPLAAIRIATDLFLEGRITGKTLIARITPDHIRVALRPVLDVTPDLRQLGTGLPASGGAATGLAAFSSDSVIRLHSAGSPAVFIVRDDLGYIPEMEVAVGIISLDGGITSHAARASRSLGTPCVGGVGWTFNFAERAAVTPGGLLHEEDPVTIDGSSGIVFKGRANVKVPNAMEDARLVLVLRLIDALAAEDELPEGYVGRAWGVRDLIAHGSDAVHQRDIKGQLQDWHSTSMPPKGSRTCAPLKPTQLNELRQELEAFQLCDSSVDFECLWVGLRGCFLRLLAKHVGLGRHPQFYRPLFDPLQAILEPEQRAAPRASSQARIQYIGEEFFSVNHHVPEYIEIESIRIYCALRCENPQDLWRLDRTNPSGEKLLQGAANLLALKVVVNDAAVPLSQLPGFYNYLRRKEYFWDWYRANGLTRHEITRMLADSSQVSTASADPVPVLQRAGLLSADGAVTKVGRSLLHGSSAIDRVDDHFRVGW